MIYFIIYLILSLLLFHVTYALAVFGFSIILHKIGISMEKRIFLAFLVMGGVTGFLVVGLWPYDVIVLINLIIVLLGDGVYQLSITCLGNPNSPQAHFTIPWILRIPKVYFFTSLISWGLIGLLIQVIYNTGKKYNK